MGFELAKAWVRVQADTSQLIPDVKAAQPGLENAVSAIAARINGILATIGVGIGVTAMARLGYRMAADAEQMQISFETMLGSAKEAQKTLKDLTTFAALTPFEMPEIQQAARGLVQFGERGDELMKTLKILGNAASGTSTNFGMVALIFNQIRGVGKLLTQDFRQLSTRGILSMQDIAKHFKVTTAEAQKMISAGKVGFKDVRDILEELSKEGGRFANMMERQSQSASGLLSTLKDNYGLVLREVMKPLLEKVIKPMYKWLNANITTVVKWGVTIMSAVAAVTAFVAVTKAAAAAMAILQAFTGPKGWKALAIGAGVAAGSLIYMNKSLRGFEKDSAEAAKAAEAMAEAAKNAGSAMEKLSYAVELTEAEKGLEGLIEKVRELNPELKKLADNGKTAWDEIAGRGENWQGGLVDFGNRWKNSAEELIKYNEELGESLKTPGQRLDELNEKLRDLVTLGIRSGEEANKIFEKEWKDTPFAEVVDEMNSAREQLLRMRTELERGAEFAQMQSTMREFSKLETVTPEQVRIFAELQQRMEQVRKQLELKEAGRQLRESLMTPVEQTMKKWKEAREMFAAGAIDRETYAKFLLKEGQGLMPERAVGGRMSFVDLGKSIQDALLKKEDPQKEVAKNTKQAAQLLGDIRGELRKVAPDKGGLL